LWALLAIAPACDGTRKEDTMPTKEPVEATSDSQRLEQSARKFADEKKGWRPDQYRVELKPKRPDGKLVVHLMFLEDERRAVPGGGQSVELFVDPRTFEVVEIYRFQ
jgi:hypothetical protein